MADIARVELLPVAVTGDSSDDCDGTVDTLVVRITDSQGLAGIGECDAPPSVARAFLEMPSAHIWSLNPIELLMGATRWRSPPSGSASTTRPSTPAGAA